jgi:glycerol-3-phosphate dehydrogenase
MPAMTRDLDLLVASTSDVFDVLVVGGGIYGLTIACDAAQRGLRVALIERDDFGGGASFNHLRTIHGGLRYLQRLDVARARESVRERRTIARIAPHAVRPLPFALPLYRSVVRGKTVMRAGFLVDRLIAMGRNRNVIASHKLPGGRVFGRGTSVQRYPGLKRQGLTGAAVFHDYVMLEPDRLTFSWALAAAERGATLANHVEALSFVTENKRVVGVRARDVLRSHGSGEFDIRARVTVNATGGSIDRLLKPLGVATGIPMLKAMNLVTRRDAGEEALGGRSTSGRNLFLVPWRDRALFGTWESDRACDPDNCRVTDADIAAFTAELNQAFPALDLTPADITLVHQGVVPAIANGDRVSLQGRDQIRDHAANGPGSIEGLVTVSGAKYTTARAVAERVTNRLFEKLPQKPVASRTATTPLPGGDIHDVGLAIADARREHDEGLPTDTIPHLIAAYGSRFRTVLDLAVDRPDWRKRLAKNSPVIGAELVHAVRKEMALTLADAVIRRTPLGALGDPGEDALVRAADIVGTELRWSPDRRRAEIDAVQRFYGGRERAALRT